MNLSNSSSVNVTCKSKEPEMTKYGIAPEDIDKTAAVNDEDETEGSEK